MCSCLCSVVLATMLKKSMNCLVDAGGISRQYIIRFSSNLTGVWGGQGLLTQDMADTRHGKPVSAAAAAAATSHMACARQGRWLGHATMCMEWQ